MTFANKITVGRIVLVPVFVVQVLYYERTGEEWHRLLAMLIFGAAALSDGLDGYVARRYRQRSELGVLLDPIADKLLLVSALVLLTFDTRPHLPDLPLWLTGTVLGRDLIIAGGFVVLHFTVGRVSARPRQSGKIATVLQMATVAWALLKWDEHWLLPLSLGTALFTTISGVQYIVDGMHQLSHSPASAASPSQDEADPK